MDLTNPQITTTQLVDELFPVSYMTRRAVNLTGGPGVGKSAVSRQYAEATDAFLLDTRFGSYDITDVKGMPFPNRETRLTEFFPVRNFPTHENVEKGLFGGKKRVLWLWDEFGHAPQSIQRQAFEIVHERTVCGVPLHDGVQIVMLSNRIKDKAGVAPMPSPLPTRMYNVELVPSFDEWYSWGIGNVAETVTIDTSSWSYVNGGSILPEILAYFKRNPAQLDEFDPAKLVPNTPYCCRRSVELLSMGVTAYRILKGGRSTIPQWLCSSTIGPAVGEAIHAQFDIVLQLPTMAEIVANPATAKLPDSVGGKLIVASMVEQQVNSGNFGPTITYLKRMPKDFELAALVPAVKRNRVELAKAPEFKPWALANRNEVA